MNDKYAQNRLFQGADLHYLKNLDVELIERTYANGEVVFEEGDTGRTFYLIAEGTIRISKKGRGDKQETLGLLTAGDFFGEIALLDNEPRSAQASAASDTILAEIDEQHLQTIISQVPEAGLNFARFATQRLREVSDTFIHELKQSERLSLIGSMVGSIVHDFKNPMGTIRQVIYFLKQREDDEIMQEMAYFLSSSVDSMLNMTQELLDFSSGKSHVTLEPINMEQLISELDIQILGRLPDEKIQVTRNIDYHGDFTGDLSRLVRLYANIIKNAAEAMEGGGTLTLIAREEDGMLLFKITDTGGGIPPEIMNRLFEPFVTHGKPNGTGLGMAIAQSVVEAHQGTIDVDSEQGKGTTFHIRIPLDLKPGTVNQPGSTAI